MKNALNLTVSRRAVLGGGVTGLAALLVPNAAFTLSGTIVVRIYQGYFKTFFEKTILPDFTGLTGVAARTVADTSSADWLIELEKSARIGVAAADVSMMSRTTILQGIDKQLWAPINLSKVPYSRHLAPQYISRYSDGRVAAIGASTWTTVDDTAYWAVSKASKATAQTQAFLDYMCRPTVQSQLVDALGVDPTVAV